MTKYSIAAAALMFAVSSGFAFAQDSAESTALPVIKDGQCFDNAQAAQPSLDQNKCRAALGKMDNPDTGSITPPAPANPNPPGSGGSGG
jgi:hypothetical protein